MDSFCMSYHAQLLILEIEPTVLWILGKCSPVELCPQAQICYVILVMLLGQCLVCRKYSPNISHHHCFFFLWDNNFTPSFAQAGANFSSERLDNLWELVISFCKGATIESPRFSCLHLFLAEITNMNPHSYPFIVGAGYWTQLFMFAQQAVYQLSFSPSSPLSFHSIVR